MITNWKHHVCPFDFENPFKIKCPSLPARSEDAQGLSVWACRWADLGVGCQDERGAENGHVVSDELHLVPELHLPPVVPVAQVAVD